MIHHDCRENDGKGLGSNTVYKEHGEWWLSVHSGDAVTEINYCPFCGMKLE